MQMYTQGVCLCVCMSICRCFLRHNQFSAVFQPSRWCNVRVQPTTATSLGPGLKSCRSTLACLAVCFFLLIFSMVFSTYKHRLFFFRVSYKEPCATSCENLAHFKMHPKKTNWVHIPTISRRPDQNIQRKSLGIRRPYFFFPRSYPYQHFDLVLHLSQNARSKPVDSGPCGCHRYRWVQLFLRCCVSGAFQLGSNTFQFFSHYILHCLLHLFPPGSDEDNCKSFFWAVYQKKKLADFSV